jgi:hypothetical protein
MPSSKTLLILTDPADLHAAVVERALTLKGHRVLRYSGRELPEQVRVKLQYGQSGARLQVRTPRESFELDRIDAVWNRRPSYASEPAGIDPRDLAFVRQQNLFLERALNELSPQAFWVNPWNAARSAECKPLQLLLAPRCGLRIPETLISNDGDEIRGFLDAVGDCIHKPLAGNHWEEDGRLYGSYTARVRPELLPSDRMLSVAAAIFQRKLDKAFEVRAQFFGHSCLAVRIDSAALDYGEFDWRLHQRAAAANQAIELPASVQAACRRLLSELGLVAGAFDFIVTPEGEWNFLEVNEAGQFLFLEDWVPSLPVIDAFCEFIVSGSYSYRHLADEAPPGLSLAELRRAMWGEPGMPAPASAQASQAPALA